MRKLLVICAAVIACCGAIYGDCPGGNCPTNQPAGGFNYGYYPGWSWGNPYGWSWGYQQSGSAGGQLSAPGSAAAKAGAEANEPTPNTANPGSGSGSTAQEEEPPAKTKEEEGAKKVTDEKTAVTEKKETEPRETAPDTHRGGGHLVFSRYPGDPGRNEFVLADRDGRALAFIRLYWRDPKNKDRVGVSINDGDVEGVKTWRQEIWTEMQKDLEGEEE